MSDPTPPHLPLWLTLVFALLAMNGLLLALLVVSVWARSASERRARRLDGTAREALRQRDEALRDRERLVEAARLRAAECDAVYGELARLARLAVSGRSYSEADILREFGPRRQGESGS